MCLCVNLIASSSHFFKKITDKCGKDPTVVCSLQNQQVLPVILNLVRICDQFSS